MEATRGDYGFVAVSPDAGGHRPGDGHVAVGDLDVNGGFVLLSAKILDVRRPLLVRLMREMAVTTSERLPYPWRLCQAIRPLAAISAA
jgi:hypothetical protein